MAELIIDSMENFEQAVATSLRISFLFKASWDASSVDLAEALDSNGPLSSEGDVKVKVLDLGDEDVASFALDLGVSMPGTAMLYRSGVKVAMLAPATKETLTQALAELKEGTAQENGQTGCHLWDPSRCIKRIIGSAQPAYP